jgi:NAD+ synthase
MVMDKTVLDIDPEQTANQICKRITSILGKVLRRRGLVVALSGGVDSSVCAALSVRALGRDKVFGLLLPEQDSANVSSDLGQVVAEQLGINYLTENISATLEAIGCYHWRDQAIRALFPDYESDWKNKLVIRGGLQGSINYFELVVQKPDGEIQSKRLPHREYLQIVAATNYKQRIRKTVEYFHADRLHYAVVGTPNLLEYDLGFFVKNGDGSADVKPIAHLYKTQVYALARYLGLPSEVCNAVPTTDTYSLAQAQDEFYFALPYDQMDLCLYGVNNGIPAADMADVLGLTAEQIDYVYQDIAAKRNTTRYLHMRPQLIDDFGRHAN